MTRLHLPHPHLADRFIDHLSEGIFAGLLHRHRPDPIVPDGHDWPEWHWQKGEGEW